MARAMGFSLLESLIVLAVISVLTASGLSVMDGFRRYRFYNDINAQLSMLAFARSTAASRYVSVSICPSENGVICGKQWAKGMLAFEDYDGDSALGARDKVLAFFARDTQVASINWTSFSGRNAVIFDAKGLASASNGTFVVCDQQGRLAKKIIISRGGRLRLSNALPADCQH